MEFFSTIRKVMVGKAGKKKQGIYMSIIGAYTLITFLVAISVDPRDFSIVEVWISGLGDPGYNPAAIFFQTSFFSFGFGMVPTLLYIYRRIGNPLPVAKKSFLIISLIGTCAWGIVGFLPEGVPPIQDVHDITAYIAFGGYALSLPLLFGIMLSQRIRGKNSWPNIQILLTVYAIIIIFEVLFIVFPIAKLEFSQWAPWEWVGYFIIAGSIYSTFLFIPTKNSQ